MGRDNENGASSVEYALLATGIAMVILVAVFVFGGNVGELFNSTCEAQSSTC